ncbi:hypothetical protein B0H10DRAFT_2040751, partial [Mycena sp. CBHHK59/15]
MIQNLVVAPTWEPRAAHLLAVPTRRRSSMVINRDIIITTPPRSDTSLVYPTAHGPTASPPMSALPRRPSSPPPPTPRARRRNYSLPVPLPRRANSSPSSLLSATLLATAPYQPSPSSRRPVSSQPSVPLLTPPWRAPLSVPPAPPCVALDASSPPPSPRDASSLVTAPELRSPPQLLPVHSAPQHERLHRHLRCHPRRPRCLPHLVPRPLPPRHLLWCLPLQPRTPWICRAVGGLPVGTTIGVRASFAPSRVHLSIPTFSSYSNYSEYLMSLICYFLASS